MSIIPIIYNASLILLFMILHPVFFISNNNFGKGLKLLNFAHF